MTRKQIVDEIANDGVWFVAKFRHYATDQCSAAPMPFEIDRTMKISSAVDLRPAVRTSRLFLPSYDEAEFPFQLRIIHDLAA